MPKPAFLTWTPTADANINLAKIIGSYGQELSFDITEGAEYVELDGNFLYIVLDEPSQAGNTKVDINSDPALASVLNTTNAVLDIEIILQTTVYEISTPADFLAINSKLFGKFKLTQNIDLSGVEFFGIGSSQTPFNGQINGDGYSVINAVVKTKGEDKKGLFNATNGAKIEKLGVVNFSFSGSSTTSGSADLGGLVGSCKSTTIDQCYLSGNIVGRDHVGAFVGGDCNDVTITNSYADAVVRSGYQAGGFFGVSAGNVTVENCYFTGSVTTDGGWAGGIIGLIDAVGEIKISNSVSMATISSGEKAGHFIGGNIDNRGTISLFKNNLYDFDAIINTNGEEWTVTPEIEITGVVEYPVGKLIEDLQKQSTYVGIGWNFSEIWSIDEGNAFPVLSEVPVQTSVNPIVENTNDYIVYCSDNNVFVTGIKEAATIAIYNINGQKVAQSVFNSDAIIPLTSKGFYIVRVSEKGKATSFKIVNK